MHRTSAAPLRYSLRWSSWAGSSLLFVLCISCSSAVACRPSEMDSIRLEAEALQYRGYIKRIVRAKRDKETLQNLCKRFDDAVDRFKVL